MLRGFALILFAILSVCGAQAVAQDAAAPPASALHPSGLPLPRFASLKADKAYVRAGPGMQYPFVWVYRREGLPVEIVQEYEQWRKIRDADGSEGWINTLLLSGRRTAMIRGADLVAMHESASPGARITAKLEPGVLADLKKCAELSCQISTGGYTGWVARNSLWGIYAHEELN